MEAITPRSLNPMSEEQLRAFLEAVKADAGLQEKLKEAGDAEAVVEIAKAAGFWGSFWCDPRDPVKYTWKIGCT